jgi:hypothetical protein
MLVRVRALALGRRTEHRSLVLRHILNRLNSPKTVNLKLLNIVVVKGFYINIISKALLRKKGL